MDLIIKAAQFARDKHAGQLRKYTHRPYIEHPARVAGMTTLLDYVDEHVVAAAWLHDVVEDCAVSLETIDEMFNPHIAGFVADLTNTSKLTHPNANRAARKQVDRERLSGCCAFVQQIKLIDRIDNLREMTLAPRDFRAVYCLESRQLLEAIGAADTRLANELLGAIVELESL